VKVVVLGASGNAGVALLRALESEPRVEDVVAIARRPPADWPSSKTAWRSLDIATEPVEPVIRGADVVVHLAWLIQPARDVEQCRAVNVLGSHRVLAAVAEARVPALVYASSVGAYSRGPKDRLVDETWPTGGVPTSFYSRHKGRGRAAARRLRARASGCAGAAAAFHMRLTPTPPGWIDMALGVPLMDTSRARAVLGWQPRRESGSALMELLDAIRSSAGFPTPTLRPGGDGRLRFREILSGLGSRGIG
jgi:nucleoside-diphosphate-sugar epimerase